MSPRVLCEALRYHRPVNVSLSSKSLMQPRLATLLPRDVCTRYRGGGRRRGLPKYLITSASSQFNSVRSVGAQCSEMCAASNVMQTFAFKTTKPHTCSRFGPRSGQIIFRHPGDEPKAIETPGLLTSTSRGVVPHLSRDHCRITKAIQWVNVTFESFLEHNPPVPTLQPGLNPLHTFLGFPPSRYLLSLSVRDPADDREMPPNGNDFVSALCVRGVRKVTPATWRSYVLSCKPDIVVALSDIPFTKPPYSQKRLTKSIERSTAWLSEILRSTGDVNPHPLNVLVHMAGGNSPAARRVFAEGLLERLHGPEAEVVKPLKCLDEGVVGYAFDYVPLRQVLISAQPAASFSIPPRPVDAIDSEMIPLLQASLQPLPQEKIRVVNSAPSPHSVLRLIRDVGIDIFDGRWAQRAADIGIALNFAFPASQRDRRRNPPIRSGKQDLGLNLYDERHASDFQAVGGMAGESAPQRDERCPCEMCSPESPSMWISHSATDPTSLDEQSPRQERPALSCAYLHHLLRTHEMTAHALLVMHNLTVMDSFFTGIRQILAMDVKISGSDQESEGGRHETDFTAEVERFMEYYDEGDALFAEAELMWREVEMARGKGRLARERAQSEDIEM